MSALITATERIYRELSSPSVSTAKVDPEMQPRTSQEDQISLTREDVDAILQNKRVATAEQLEFALNHAEEFGLMSWQKDKLAIQFTIAAAAKTRAAHGIRENAFSQFLSGLGIHETPFGLLHNAEWFASELSAGTKAIACCGAHRVPLCPCWCESREKLYSVREQYGERSPESWAAIRTWDALEKIELSRPRQ